MTYWALNAVFLTVALAVAIAAMRVLTAARRKAVLAAAGGAAVVVLVLTAVFDNLMIAAGLFSYSSDRISGVSVGLAPLEDFAYPVAAVLLLPSLWIVLGERSRKRRP
ncbi:lycopene cyclase domain-containing protein [Pseudarthrobacter sp. NamE5]|uniref:lycopene cyclase domain-containing protein n=1 Tax=Pseudarthrobacter sp. NamE5 TaxID=2576839 RepID=UPI00110B8DF1|nr:lycopene cyclase domain-containing protein [Pseudarthrobacter sp. NamE5]TLM87708.1 lycopene cyclase domain-containing protein [Pseudarthrobacter sp. NamE5]